MSVLEGGYNVPILAGCVAAHLGALGAERKPDQPTQSGRDTDDPDGI